MEVGGGGAGRESRGRQAGHERTAAARQRESRRRDGPLEGTYARPNQRPARQPADPISRPPPESASLPPGKTRPEEEEEGRTSQLPRGADGRHGSGRQESRPARAALCLHRQLRGHVTLTGRRPGRRRSPLAGRLRDAQALTHTRSSTRLFLKSIKTGILFEYKVVFISNISLIPNVSYTTKNAT